MRRERQPVRLGGARIEHAKQNTLAAFYADRLPGTKHLPVDCEQMIVHIPFHFGPEIWLPIMQDDGKLGIVAGGILPRLHDHHPELPGIHPDARVLSCHAVSVIPARTGWLRRKCVTAGVAGLDMGGAFFMRAIHVRRDAKPVPMDQFRKTRAVHNVHRDRLSFSHPQQRTGDLSVIAECFYGMAMPQIGRNFFDAKSYVRSGSIRSSSDSSGGQACSGKREKLATVHTISSLGRSFSD